MPQPGFDFTGGRRGGKAAAIAQVAAHADPAWLERAYLAVGRVAQCQAELTTDDVWETLGRSDAPVREARAIGPVMLRARREGLIAATDRIRLSVLGAGRWKVRVWVSCVYLGASR